MKLYLLFTFMFVAIQLAQALPEKYMKKNYIDITSKKVGSKYYYSYKFKDQAGRDTVWRWSVDASENDRLSEGFGIDPRFVSNGMVTTNEAINNYFRTHNNRIGPDYSYIINSFSSITFNLYQQFRLHSMRYSLNRREQVELLLRLMQDLPYGIVPTNFNGKYVNGVMPLTEIFKVGWSDCDSKSLLMAAILSHHPYFYDKLAIISVPGHALLGIQGIPRPYDNFVEYQGAKYIYAEPVGVTRTPYGKTNSPYSRSIDVNPLKIHSTFTRDSSNVDISNISERDCNDGSFLIDYTSEFSGIRTVACRKKEGVNFIGHGPEIIYKRDGRIGKINFYVEGKLLGEDMFDDLEDSKPRKHEKSEKVEKDVPTSKLNHGDCPDDGLLIQYDSLITGGKIQSCKVKVGSKFIEHGPTIYYKKNGTISKRKEFDMGKEIR